MDFRRSTLVLLLSYLILNIFLFSILWQIRVENRTNSTTSVNIMDQIKADGITVTGANDQVELVPIMELTPQDPGEDILTLSDQSVAYSNGVIEGTLFNPITIPIQEGAVPNEQSFTALTDFVQSGNVVHGEEYMWFSYNPQSRQVLYSQKANRFSIMDGTSQIVFQLDENNQVSSYKQTYAGQARPIGNNREMISSQKAIENLYLAGRIPKKSTVTMVQLTYYQSLTLSSKELSIYSPAWYVEIVGVDGQIVSRRVDAIRGSVLTNSSENNSVKEVTP